LRIRYLTRWLIPLPAILFALIPQNANAEPIPGIETVYYTIDEIPPTQSDTEYLICGTEVENNINRNYDYELYEDCTGDLFMVHMTGFINIPEHDTIEFMLATDDGGEMEIDGNTFGNWNDQGCSWMMSGELILEPGSNAFNVWMYEHGGNSCIMLAWKIDNEGWAIVPDEVFTTNGIPTTTTSSSTTTTIALTTTTSSSTTVQETTTSWEPTTTSTIPTTTSTTTVVQTTVPVTTTTTSLPVPTATTTTTEAPVSTTTTQPEKEERESEDTQETTSPTNEPLPGSTINESETTVDESDTTVEETSTTDLPDLPEESVETVPDETFLEDVPDETNAPEVEEEPEEYTPDTTEVEEPYSSSTTLPDIPVDEPVTDEQIEEILDTLIEAEPEQIVAAITQVLAAEITSDQATEIASSPEVLAAITEDQAEQLFEQIEVEELTEEQLEEFTEAIQEAPTKVKKAFEKTIDIFGSQFEDYVPTGSSIPVKTRRTLVAAGALIAAMPSTRIRR
jgi:hypothetical protein